MLLRAFRRLFTDGQSNYVAGSDRNIHICKVVDDEYTALYHNGKLNLRRDNNKKNQFIFSHLIKGRRKLVLNNGGGLTLFHCHGGNLTVRNEEKTQTVIGFVVESNGTIVPVFNRIIFTSHDSPKSRLHLHGEQWRMRHIFIVITRVRFAAVSLATLRKRAASSSLCFHRHRHGSQHGRLWCPECLSCHLPEHQHCVGIFLIMTFTHEEGFPLQIFRKPK